MTSNSERLSLGPLFADGEEGSLITATPCGASIAGVGAQRRRFRHG
jgi:hypothetical protein